MPVDANYLIALIRASREANKLVSPPPLPPQNNPQPLKKKKKLNPVRRMGLTFLNMFPRKNRTDI